jgi:Ca2+-binding RTX toxin-like protein
VGEGGTAMGRLVSFEAGGPQRIDASGATAAWEIATTGNGDTLLGGAGDDILRHERSEFAGAPRSLVDGGPGRDIFRSGDPGRLDMDFTGIDFRNVEVFEGSGKFRPAQIAAFEELRGIGTIEIVSGGRVDLTGKVTSAAFTRFDTGAPFLTIFGPVGPLDLTMTDPRFQLTISTGPGIDTVTTGAGNDTIRDWWTADWSTGDRIDAGDGSDRVNSGRGDDVIVTWATEADGNDLVVGGEGNDSISTGPGNDRVFGYTTEQNDRDTGNDTIDAGPGADFVIGAGGDDILIGGPDEGDLADVLNGNGGNDLIRGGAGNDSALGGDGADTLDGGTGSDTLIGHAGDDLITGGPGSDLIFGGPGDEFINGGFGSDRINGGAGADRFFHALDPGHGSDWIQDFAAEDALVAPNGSSAADFQVNRANTPGAGAADVDEAFVIYRPTGQILWALVDGAALPAITLRIDEVPFDLLA